VVIERAREEAARLGISGNLAEELLLLLIRSSLTVQEQDRVAARGGGSGKRVLVIGGAGKMGRWFCRFLGSPGLAVGVAGPSGTVGNFPHRDDYRDAEIDHDLVLVAAPLGMTGRILHDLARRPPPGVVFDIGSLKSPLRSGLRALAEAGARVTSVHPMFGPDT